MSEPLFTPKYIPDYEVPDFYKKTCPKCGCEKTVKSGVRYNKKGTSQRWECKACGTTFSHSGYFRGKHELALIQYAHALYKSGLSSRQVVEALAKNAHIYVTHVTVCRWLKMLGSIRPKNPHSYNPQDPEKIKINSVTEISIMTVVSFADSKHPKKSILLENKINISI